MKFNKVFFTAFLALSVVSCSEDEEPNLGPQAFNGNDLAIATQSDEISGELDDMLSLFSQIELGAAKDAAEAKYVFPECVTITQVTEFPTVTRVLDFGTGCAWFNGRSYEGILTLVYTLNNSLKVESVVLSSESFKIDGIAFAGTKTATLGTNDAGNRTSSVETDMTVTWPGGTSAVVTGTTVREWIEGFDSGTWGDNVFLITGNRTIVTSTGKTYAVAVEEALRRELSCRFIVSGVMRFDLEIPGTLWLDFGEGTCDNKATLSDADGNTWEVALRE